MKATASLALASLLALASPLFGAPPQLVATVTGSTTVEEDIAGGGTTIVVKPLNNARVLSEFEPLIDPKDYAVVVEANLLRIVPKAKMSILLSYDVLEFKAATYSVHKTKPNITQGAGVMVGATPVANIFNQATLTGTYFFTLTAATAPSGVAKAVNTAMAAGLTHFGPQANKSLMLQCKVTTGKLFEPK